MNKSSLRKIGGDIFTRKGRTALVAVSIFIGVLGVVVLITAGDLIVRQMNEDIQAEELPMVQEIVSVPGDGDAIIDNSEYLDILNSLDGIDVVEGQANYPFFWKNTDESRFRESRIFAFSEDFEDVQIQPLRLVHGEYPTVGSQELAIEQRMADDFELGVGDTIDVRILNDELTTETWTIVGIVFHPYNQQPSDTMYAAYEDAQCLGGFTGFSGIYARYTDYALVEDNLDTFSTAIAEETPYNVVFTMFENPEESSIIETTKQFTQILSALAIVAMVVSGFLVINVVSNIVVEQRKQIGVMKSLGATRFETFNMYAGIAFVYGLLGMVPGVLLGIPLGYQMAVIVGDFANTMIDGFAISPLAVGLGTVLGIGIPVFASVLPVYNGTKVTILDAMTDLGITANANADALTKFVRRLPLPMNIKMSLSNITQKKGRLALTIVTLTLAVSAFMGVSGVFYELNSTLQNLLDTFQYDAQIQPTTSQDYEKIRTLIMENVDEVEDVYPGTGAAVQVDGYVSALSDTSQLLVTGIDPAAPLLDFDLQEGEAWTNDPQREGIVLTNEVVDQVGKSVGDTIVISLSGRELELEIIGIANFPFDIGFMQWQQLAEFTGNTQGAPVANQYFTSLPLAGYSGTLPDNAITMWGINDQVASFVQISGGNALVSGEPQVMITADLAENGHYAVGDTVTLGETDYTITGIFSPPAQMASSDLPTDLMAIYWEDLAAIEGLDLNGNPVPNVFFVTSKLDNPTAREVDAMIEDINDVLVANGITGSYQNQVELTNQASESILSIGVVLNMASLVMAAVGAIGLLTTLSISVFERQKEIGVMRSVGAKSPVIIIQFLVEGILVGMVAWIIAVPIGAALGFGLMELLPFGEFIDFAVSPVIIFSGLLGVLFIATVSSIWPSLSAARRTVSDILRYQ